MPDVSSLIQWFNANSGFAMALLTAVYVVATLVIVLQSRHTNKLQAEALRQSEEIELARKRPYVALSLEFERDTASRYDSSICLYAHIRNYGAGAAINVLAVTDPPSKAG
jgi:hypothetical protein